MEAIETPQIIVDREARAVSEIAAFMKDFMAFHLSPVDYLLVGNYDSLFGLFASFNFTPSSRM